MKPLVGVTAFRISVVEDDGFDSYHEAVPTAYLKAVAKAGAVPVPLSVLDPEDSDALNSLLDRFDAIVITGGADVDPANYGAATDPQCGTTEPHRDAHDLAIARACVARNQPTLAICRGIQVLNVALGGTLIQHIDDHMQLSLYNEKVHEIDIEQSSLLAAIVDAEHYWTNSLHHQCLADLGTGIKATARADDGTIEAVEVEHAPNVLGVQWHPEMIRYDRGHLELFRRTFSL